jgi:hypothetical protein
LFALYDAIFNFRELMESGGKKLLLAEKKSSVSRATE